MSTSTGKEMRVSMGCLAPSLEVQLAGQGIRFKDPKDAEAFQNNADAISRMTLSGVITDGEATKIRNRIMKQMTKVVECVEE